MQTPKSTPRPFLWKRGAEILLCLSAATAFYLILGGRFSLQDGENALWMLGVLLTIGWSAFQVFRYGVRFFPSKVPIWGYAALVTGMILTIPTAIRFMSTQNAASRHEMAFVIRVGAMCGLLGGVFGSMEAKNRP